MKVTKAVAAVIAVLGTMLVAAPPASAHVIYCKTGASAITPSATNRVGGSGWATCDPPADSLELEVCVQSRWFSADGDFQDLACEYDFDTPGAYTATGVSAPCVPGTKSGYRIVATSTKSHAGVKKKRKVGPTSSIDCPLDLPSGGPDKLPDLSGGCIPICTRSDYTATDAAIEAADTANTDAQNAATSVAGEWVFDLLDF